MSSSSLGADIKEPAAHSLNSSASADGRGGVAVRTITVSGDATHPVAGRLLDQKSQSALPPCSASLASPAASQVGTKTAANQETLWASGHHLNSEWVHSLRRTARGGDRW